MIFLFPLDGADGGTYPLTITNDDGHTEVCQVTVADTTAPEVKVQDVTVYEGGEVTLEDLLVEATDLAGDVTTKLLQEIDTTTAGTYKATDPNGNVATVDCTVTVRKDEDAPVFSGLKDLTTAKGKKPNYTTEEGLYVGDDLARVTELYGDDYTENGSELIYTKGKTCLSLILNDGAVISMEYRMAT